MAGGLGKPNPARTIARIETRWLVKNTLGAHGEPAGVRRRAPGPGDPDSLAFPDSAGGYMRGSNVRRRWWSSAVTAAQWFPRTVTDTAGMPVVMYEFKLHELRHTAASLAIQAGANIKALQNMLGHESAGLTLDRYGHLYGSDVEAVGVAINALLTRDCGQNVVTEGVPADTRC